jgi:hypothetical protein
VEASPAAATDPKKAREREFRQNQHLLRKRKQQPFFAINHRITAFLA